MKFSYPAGIKGKSPDERALEQLVLLAKQAQQKSSPLISRFPVGAALLIGSDQFSSGSNIEYGGGFGQAETRAIHAEEAALAGAVDRFGPKITISAVAVYENSKTVTACCGNCLDVLATYSKRETVLIDCGPEKEPAVISFSDALPERYSEVKIEMLTPIEELLLDTAIEACELGNFSMSGLNRRSGAAVLDDHNQTFLGAREDNLAYHPISALDGAFAHARASGAISLNAAALVSTNGAISGRDRQRIFERASELGRLDSFKILLYDLSNKTLRSCVAKELLPFGFGPAALGSFNLKP